MSQLPFILSPKLKKSATAGGPLGPHTQMMTHHLHSPLALSPPFYICFNSLIFYLVVKKDPKPGAFLPLLFLTLTPSEVPISRILLPMSLMFSPLL